METLFALANWHALAKLRQHTDPSLDVLELATVQLGKLLRKFQTNTCSAYQTQESPREMAARVRKMESKSTPNKSVELESGATETTTQVALTMENTGALLAASKPRKAAGRQPKKFNLKTYKDHSLGDYVESIRQNGTVDSYSTESVSYMFMFAYFFSKCLLCL